MTHLSVKFVHETASELFTKLSTKLFTKLISNCQIYQMIFTTLNTSTLWQ